MLAWYLYKTWNFEAALDYALYSVIPVLTESMIEIRREIMDYQYSNLQDFFATARTIGYVQEYLSEKNIYEKLYYLALISYENIPTRRTGVALLRILAVQPEANGYQRSAQRQLQNPERESRIDIRKIEK